MKKKILTLGLFAAMMLGAAQIANATYSCSTFSYWCADGTGHTGLVCGENDDEKAAMRSLWGVILCGPLP